jgi:hypothetical protein
MSSYTFVEELSKELCQSEINTHIITNICIEGNRDGFNSKMAIEKFKKSIKKMNSDNLNLDELQKKYVKPTYKLEIIKHLPGDKEIIIKILEIQVPIVSQSDNKKLLKEKIKSMSNHRKNFEIHKAKTDDNVTDEILKEYAKLKKISKIPVPDPSEMLSNPEQYKPILNMVLNNKMLNSLSTNHPYIKYFKLIAEKLNINFSDKPPENIVQNIIGNKISSNDDDTDEED